MAETNGEFVRITNREVWEKLNTIDAKLNNALSKDEQRQKRVNELEERTRSLELKFYAVAAGLLAAVGLLLAGPQGVFAAGFVLPPYIARRLARRKDDVA